MRTILLALILSALTTLLHANEKPPTSRMIGEVPAAKVLFLGNSITLHSPAPAIGWTGNWGMAASSREKDYVHLLSADIATAAGAPPKTMVKNIADFERGYETFDIATKLKPELEFKADIVVVAIGENTNEPKTDDARANFAAAFTRLLDEIKKHGQPTIFVRSSFWPNETKDGIMRKASMDAGATFVDIAALGFDRSNAAGSERKIEHAGVAGHPGDKGMRAIADAIFAAIKTKPGEVWPRRLLGYTQLRTDLTGGRHTNVRTMRAKVVKADGSERRELAAELVDEVNAWTQFGGWSPDGSTALIARGWQSPANAMIEEQRQSFHFTEAGWLLDTHLVDVASGESQNVTGVDRVSFYNGGLFFWPGDASKLGFTALIDGNSHPFRMDRDGHNKLDLTQGSQEFTYGFSSSRDGSRIAYHKSYQIYLADADGTKAVHIETGQPFNFGPTWSPDGKWVLFVSGEHYNCHPHIVRANGTSLTKLADRGGYRGVMEFLDVPDFHGGSSDTPVWSTDSTRVFYTARVGTNVELFAVNMDGKIEQLTKSEEDTLHYHPQPSPDGNWLVYGSKREGVRQLYVMQLAKGQETRITNLTPGHAAMWPHWQPLTADKGIMAEQIDE
ncbi:MAG: PD40 domain-containing protein [Planctomycetes bacterium]|nr:PD40 domain-containing protein [Planctomycetota bacterium]